jgi:hypothetical protein
MLRPKNLPVRISWRNRALTPIFFFSIAACSAIDHQRVEGWPELQIVEHRVPAEEMVSRCQKYTGAASRPLACAEFKLAARRCDIWLSESFAPPAVVEHERLHCAGYDHVGSTSMKRLLEAHQGEGVTAAAAGASVGR